MSSQETAPDLLGALASAQAQAEAWQSVLRWVCAGPSTVDTTSRLAYAEALLEGRPFEDWFDDLAGRPQGFNAPPPAILMILRPYLLGRQHEGA